MSTIVAEQRRLAIRPLLIPAEHGGWGFLLEPIVLGLLVAPSASGGLIALAMMAVFLMRHPLKLGAQDWLRRRRFPRTAACERFVAAYGLLAGTFLAAAVVMSSPRALVPLMVALPFAMTQFALDMRNRSRTLPAEMLGAIAPGAAATSIALAAGSPITLAVALWLMMILRAAPAILYVRSLLRGESRWIMLGAHVLAAAAALVFAPPAAIAALSILCLRALPRPRHAPARTIGLREFFWGALTVVLIALGFR